MSNELSGDNPGEQKPAGTENCPRPYRLGRRGEAVDRNRARMLEAARGLLRTEGLVGVTMEAVAREAGVSRQTVHNQFGSRTSLLAAVFDSVAMGRGLDRLPEAFQEQDALRALDKLIEIFTGFWGSDDGLIPRLDALAAVDPDLAQSISTRPERRRWGLTRIVERLQEQGYVRGGASSEVLVDTLALLTGPAANAELARGGRAAEEIASVLKQLARAALHLEPGTPP